MGKIRKLFIELLKELDALNDKEMGETGLWEEVIAPLRKLGSRFGLSYFEYYMVLGLKSYPQNPNDYGMVNEADNPLLLSYDKALELAKLVDATAEEHGIGGKFALVVKVISDF